MEKSVISAIFVKKMVWGNGEAIELVEMDDPVPFYPLIRFYLWTRMRFRRLPSEFLLKYALIKKNVSNTPLNRIPQNS